MGVKKLEDLFKKFYLNLKALKYLLTIEINNKVKISFWNRIKALRHGFASCRYELYNFDQHNIRDFVSDFADWKTSAINDPYIIVTKDKSLFKHLLKTYEITPKNYGFIKNKEIIFQNKVITSEALIKIIEDKQSLIFKSNQGSGGAGIFRIDFINNLYFVNKKLITKEALLKLIMTLDDHIISESLVPIQFAEEIFPDTINTIRIITMRDPITSEVFIPFAIHKFGSVSSIPVDNFAKGGIVVKIDVETGTLSKVAQKGTPSQVIWYDHHPETKVLIKGKIIPEWAKIKKQLQL